MRLDGLLKEIMMARPDDLPDFSNPPIAEAVLGVQFQQVPGFSSIYSKDVWDLFSEKFPKAEEQQELPPQFEVFGGQQITEFQFRLSNGPFGKRFWFVSMDDNQILQFQNDRFHHNWRKTHNVESLGNSYPRFDPMVETFRQNLMALEGYFKSSHGLQDLVVTQVELTYVNHMTEQNNAPIRWFKALDLDPQDVEGFSFACSKVLANPGRPMCRLHTSINSAYGPSGERLLRHDLTVRGSSTDGAIESAVNFLHFARDTIVWEFTNTTTDEAHVFWGRKS